MTKELQFKLRYSKMSLDEGKWFRHYCDEAEADQVTLSVDGLRYELEFKRWDSDPKLWDCRLNQTISMLQQAYTQGDAHARTDIRDTFRGVLGV